MPVNAVRFGANAGGADDTSLFLKMYTGNLTAAPRTSIFLWDPSPLIYRTTAPNGGKSHQYLMFSDLPEAEEFTPGDEMLGQAFAIEEGTIGNDKYVVEHNYVPRDQMNLSHFEVLRQLALKHTRKLQEKWDRRLFALACLGARQTSAVTKNGLNIHNGANRVTRSGGSTTLATALAAAYPKSTTGAANLRADIRTLAEALDDDNIPDGPEYRGIFLTPWARSVLLYDNTAQVFSKDYVSEFDGNNIQRREVTTLEGFRVLGTPSMVSNNGPMPSTNVTTGPSRYQGNFTPQASNGTPVALTFCKTHDESFGVGLVQYEGIIGELVYVPQRKAYFVAAGCQLGADIMHPYCLGSIEVTSA